MTWRLIVSINYAIFLYPLGDLRVMFQFYLEGVVLVVTLIELRRVVSVLFGFTFPVAMIDILCSVLI